MEKRTLRTLAVATLITMALPACNNNLNKSKEGGYVPAQGTNGSGYSSDSGHKHAPSADSLSRGK
jgi:hypothetical protein